MDSLDEVTWRLRSLCGLVNTRGARIVAVGGAGAWAHGNDVVSMVKTKWKLDIRELPYAELGSLIKAARADSAAVSLARHSAEVYLKQPGTSLETGRPFVENAMLLDQVFRGVLAEQKCRAITINQCMGTIMPVAETSACLTLSTLNDDGYLAFCESDFVVIPAGMLIASIAGHPMFMNDPTYPHDGVITLAHCTASRKLDGRTVEPARILTHFESDYGAGAEGGNADRPEGDEHHRRFCRQALGGCDRRDRRSPVPADLPFADRCQVPLRQPQARRAHARLPLDDRLRRLPSRGRLRPQEDPDCLRVLDDVTGDNSSRHSVHQCARFDVALFCYAPKIRTYVVPRDNICPDQATET